MTNAPATSARYFRAVQYIRAVQCLRQGGVIAYPTEAVYGLGCDPFNAAAVNRLLAIKQRSVQKGLIIIAGSIEQMAPWIESLPKEILERCLSSWPGPITWVVPLAYLKRDFPYWVTGDFESVALRVSDHPDVQQLCVGFKGPIVSTSANLAGRQPAVTALQVRKSMGNCIDEIIVGKVGGLLRPTTIKDAVTNTILRR